MRHISAASCADSARAKQVAPDPDMRASRTPGAAASASRQSMRLIAHLQGLGICGARLRRGAL